MKRQENRINFTKILVIVILIWCVSASHSYYVSSMTPSSYGSYLSGQDESFIGGILDKIIPGKISIKAKSAIVVDAVTGEELFAKNKNLRLPIASLTKLAAVLVFFNAKPDLSKTITITRADLNNAGRSKLYVGDSITLNDCLHFCLMCSDNAATKALARAAGLDGLKFISEMNNLASTLGMFNTHFVDPTGRSAGNVSTAADLIKLIRKAYYNQKIAEISGKISYRSKPLNKDKAYILYNTNRLLYNRQWKIRGGKTGHISQSGYCLALDVYDNSGRQVEAVLLGSPSNNYRYRDAHRLLMYAFKE